MIRRNDFVVSRCAVADFSYLSFHGPNAIEALKQFLRVNQIPANVFYSAYRKQRF
jgi:hypothetical protein